jgi:hypothetical protein
MPQSRHGSVAGDGAPNPAAPPPPSSAEEDMQTTRTLRPCRARVEGPRAPHADEVIHVYERGNSFLQRERSDRFHDDPVV